MNQRWSPDLALAHRLAGQAARIAARHFDSDALRIRTKDDGSPVTDADTEIERALRAVLAEERPGAGFLGEEVGASGPGRRTWIVDGVDGTASFVAGEPEWGTLIGLAVDEVPVLGVVAAPALGRRWWAERGAGAWSGRPWMTEAPAPTRLAVTGTSRLATATVAVWPPPSRLTETRRRLAARIAASAGATLGTVEPTRKPSTGSGTCHGALLVATGQVDAFLLLGGGPWDIAALVPIVEEAGGRAEAGLGLFSNGGLHDEILDVIRQSDL